MALGIRLSPLQAAAVAPQTQQNYYTLLVALLAWLLVPRFPQGWDAAVWDLVLVDYLEHQFDSGGPVTSAGARFWRRYDGHFRACLAQSQEHSRPRSPSGADGAV